MKVDTIRTWRDEDTKEEFEVRISFLMQNIVDIEEYAHDNFTNKAPKICIRFSNDYTYVILENYDDFNKRWTEFLSNERIKGFTFN